MNRTSLFRWFSRPAPSAFWLSLTGLSLVLLGCKPEVTPPAALVPTVTGERISFATNAPQLFYLAMAPAQQRPAAAVGLYGRLAWDDDVTVRVFSPVGGRVLSLPVEVNQAVAARQVLATLDSPDYDQTLADARTATGNALAADQTYQREQALLAHGAAAQKDVEAAAAADVAAGAERSRALARLANYGGSLTATNEQYHLRSPLSGTLVEKNVNPGQELRPDLMLANAPQFTNPQFVVTDPGQLWLFLDADELTVASLSPQSEVLIHTPAYPGEVFHGRLEVIGQELDAGTRTVKVRCLVANPDHRLRAEMYVTAEVELGGPALVEVPTQAVFLKNDRHYIFVAVAPGIFERRQVSIGSEGNGRTVISEGVKAGENVVTEGALLLEALREGDNS